jgi:hypothetical protein
MTHKRAGLGFIVLLLASCLSAATSTAVVVNSVSINSKLNQITILGQGFDPAGQAPTVTFNTKSLTLVSFSNSSIVATLLTGTKPGSYQLTVKNSSANTAAFDVTVGAAGPQGPSGPAGPQGPQGQAGVQGAQGPGGPQGPSGPAGSQGQPGQAGAQGAQGVAGTQGPQGPPVTFQGTWLQTTPYNLGDAIFYSGSSYISLVAGNLGNQPDQSQSQWALLAQQGTTGATGSQGPQGLPGAMGPQGPLGQTGAQGPLGLTGAMGPQGLSGLAGPAGTAGLSINWRGPWICCDTQYYVQDAISWQGSSYIAINNINSSNPPSQDGTNWSLLAQQGVTGSAGPAGAGGVGINWRGPWICCTTQYYVQDAISWQGSSYIAINNVNSSNPPSQDQTNWSLLAQQGVTGPQGSQGLIGAMGPQGQPGTAGPQGPLGPAGAQGPQGSTGAPGAQGLQGPQGPPVQFAGVWSALGNYIMGAAVSYNGSSYISLVDNNTRNEPDTSFTQWALLALQGSTGQQGPQGLIGTMGPQGQPGQPGAQGPLGPGGPSGPAGPQGSQGTPGPVNATHAPQTGGITLIATGGPAVVVRSMNLVAGSYLIYGSVQLTNAGGIQVEAFCQLQDALNVINTSNTTAVADLMPDNNTVGSWSEMVPLETAATFSSSTVVTIACGGQQGQYPLYAYRSTLTAVQVSNLTIAP